MFKRKREKLPLMQTGSSIARKSIPLKGKLIAYAETI